KEMIFCVIRKRWLILTEEEWVRQNFVSFLIQIVGYPASLIAVEKELQLHELKKRFDILVYDPAHQPWMLIECKEPAQALSEQVLLQVMGYNLSIPVPYLVITNGSHTLGWKNEAGGLRQLQALPPWGK
ncbi:MAG TPA: type I restriction enzyme HsdR N-terminal domain-containing protein, partial [Flavisolibacter sp.]